MVLVLQGNINRSRTAHDLLAQIRLEKDADIVLVSEQYRDGCGPTWYRDALGTAAIWVPDLRRFNVADHGAGAGYVWVKSGDITYVSCYFTPNEPIADFQAKLDGLEDAVRVVGGELVVAGDFNAKAVEWGEPRPDSRGGRVLDFASRAGLVILNTGSTPTFRRPGYRGTVIDISLATENLAARVQSWQVIEDFTASDHQYITFRVRDVSPARARHATGPPRWDVARMDVERLSLAIERGRRTIGSIPQELPLPEQAARRVDSTMSLIHRACREAVPRKAAPRGGRRPAYWWTDEIAELRRKCLRLRRLAQRVSRRDPDAAQRSAEYKTAKKSLRKAIRVSKRRCWQRLGEDLNEDPWGLGYRIVLRKLGALSPSAPLETETVRSIVDALFPTHPLVPNCAAHEALDPPPFTVEELASASQSLRNRKAPGPDGLPAEVLKALAASHPELLLDMYNACLKAGVFPSRWKAARLVLISKGKGPVGSPGSYRPLCMLDTAGKLLEKLLKPRLQAAVEAAGDLSERQYGFRRGRSTVQAIQEVVDAVRATEEVNHYSRPVCLLVTLDVRNAFNSVRWGDALNALERNFRVPQYLLRMMRDYLRDRTLTYETEDGLETRALSAGAAQGSILGPDIWNYTYDGILRMGMPEGSFLVGYADDIAAVITARDVEKAQWKLNQVMRRVVAWLRNHGLELALAKTEIVLLTKKRIPLEVGMQVGDQTVQTRRVVKYLGVSLDSRLTFWDEIGTRADKAAAVTAALSRVMANIGGPRPCKRRLLLRTAEAIMLYGAEVWADAMRIEKYRKRAAGVQRRAALRIACSYRTVSEAAVLVVAGVIPIDLLARERQFVHQEKAVLGEGAAEAARARSLETWQVRWDGESRGRWTARLIPRLDVWLDRRHGEVDYHLTQMLTGHGHFRAFLHRIGKALSPRCLYCDSPSDSALHTFFECDRWGAERAAVVAEVGSITPDNVVGVMLQDERFWRSVASFARSILRQKERDSNMIPEGLS